MIAGRSHDQTTGSRAVFFNCPRCGLSLRRGVNAKIEHCPRCVGRAGIDVKLVISARRATNWHRAPVGG